jgi:predicted RNase H-like HicB family nuclease
VERVSRTKKTLTLDYWRDERWYVGRLREVPGVFSQGETLAELEENIQEAYDLMRGEASVPPAADVHTKEILVTV